jgi:hypothetical protein
MNIINDQPSVDYLTYFTEQLPKDLAAMAQLRDELAKRQGAMSAVEKANKDREKAAKELDAAVAKAALIVEDAEKVARANDTKKADLDAREAALLAEQKSFATEAAAKTAGLMAREQQVAKFEAAVVVLQTEYATKLQSVDADRIALDARIKAFQDKVAALTV